MSKKHVPQRTCVICRETLAKRALVRVVRAPDGQVSIDETGKKAGRGAYLCHKPTCWQKAIAGKQLEHALKISLTGEAKQTLAAYAERLASVSKETL